MIPNQVNRNKTSAVASMACEGGQPEFKSVEMAELAFLKNLAESNKATLKKLNQHDVESVTLNRKHLIFLFDALDGLIQDKQFIINGKQQIAKHEEARKKAEMKESIKKAKDNV